MHFFKLLFKCLLAVAQSAFFTFSGSQQDDRETWLIRPSASLSYLDKPAPHTPVGSRPRASTATDTHDTMRYGSLDCWTQTLCESGTQTANPSAAIATQTFTPTPRERLQVMATQTSTEDKGSSLEIVSYGGVANAAATQTPRVGSTQTVSPPSGSRMEISNLSGKFLTFVCFFTQTRV